MRRATLLAVALGGCGTTPSADDGAGSGTSGGGPTDGSGETSTATMGQKADTTAAASTSAGPADTSSSSGSRGETTAGASTTEGTTGTRFVHEFGTELSDDGRLSLYSNLPPAVADCEGAGPSNAPCEDEDEDGLVDAWEDAVLDRLRPLRRFDEAEMALGDDTAVFADVGRVALRGDGEWIVMVMLGYSRDYGSCGGFTSHPGDSERVAMTLGAHPEGGPGGVVFTAAYTAAHEATINDHGQVYSQAMLDELVLGIDEETGEPRWVVFPSADKHATYANIATCEGISVVPCVDEDCAPDNVGDPDAFDLLPESANAGEDAAPRLTDLGPLGFPGDDAWADQDFCGGLGGSGCSASVRSKLIDDPFP